MHKFNKSWTHNLILNPILMEMKTYLINQKEKVATRSERMQEKQA